MNDIYKDYFRELFEQAPLGYQSLDIDGNFIEVNKKWCDTFGYDRNEVIGKWFGDFLAPGFKDAFRENFNIFKEQGHIHSEFEMVRKNGEIRFIAFEGQIAYQDDGKFKQTHCILQDISERKVAEQKFKELMARHETFIDAVPDIIMEVDNNKIYTWSNKAGYDFFGDDVIGKEASYYFEDGQDIYRIVDPLFKGREDIITLETFQRRRDGMVRLLSWRCKTQKNADGEIIGAVSSATDITEMHDIQIALTKSERKYRILVENQTDLVVKVDNDGKFIYVSPSYCRTFNRTEKELLGNTFFPMVHEEDVEYTKKEMEKLYSAPHICYIEQRAMTKDGWRWFGWTDTAELNDRNEVVAIIGVGRDITEKKKAEQEVDNYRNNLEELVRERTKELEEKNEKLEKFNKLFVEREFRIKELKDRIKELEKGAE